MEGVRYLPQRLLAWIIHEAGRERWAGCGGSRAGCVAVRHRRRSCWSAKRCRLRGLGLRFVELGRGIRPEAQLIRRGIRPKAKRSTDW
jgi:hypothetical protein